MSAALEEFPKFSEFPLELRNWVWELASFQKRMFELHYDTIDQKFMTLRPPPALLHTNRESREVALRFYFLSFGTDKQLPKIYFNPVCDTIYLSSRQYIDEVAAIAKHFSIQSPSLPYQHQIQSIALGTKFWEDARYNLPFRLSSALGDITRFRSAFPHLRKVILVKGLPSETEIDSWDSYLYSGITLLESNMDELEDDIPEIIIMAFTEDTKRRPGETLEVTVMEHREERQEFCAM